MPQTREHLAILDLLAVPAGVVALTKIDLIDDPEWLDLVDAGRRRIAGRHPPGRRAHRARQRATGAGLDELPARAGGAAARAARAPRSRPAAPAHRPHLHPQRLGTVVTGTLQRRRRLR
jgi:selenocysteine-specific elongation factor